MLTGVTGKDHVILRLVIGLVAQRRAESATCSRRHAVNLVPLDEFALGSGESPLTELAFALLVAAVAGDVVTVLAPRRCRLVSV